MGLEPHVDAIEVKSVVAFRQKPGLFAINELGETNRAFQAFLEVLGAINHDGKGSEDGRLETSPESRDGRVLTWSEDETAPSPAGLLVPGRRRVVLHPPPEPLGVEVEEDDEHDDHEEDYDRDHHDLPCQLHGLGAVQ